MRTFLLGWLSFIALAAINGAVAAGDIEDDVGSYDGEYNEIESPIDVNRLPLPSASRISVDNEGALMKSDGTKEAPDPRFEVDSPLNIVFMACHQDAKRLCYNFPAFEGPCPAALEWFPYKSCYTNVCLAFHAIEIVGSVSDDCRERINTAVNVAVVSYIMDNGPSDFRQTIIYWEMIGNMSGAAFFLSGVAPLIVFFSCISCTCLIRRGRNQTKSTNNAFQSILSAIQHDPDLKKRAEDITGETFSSKPFTLTFGLESQQREFRSQRNQYRVMRAIYSDRQLKSEIQNAVKEDLGSTPPIPESVLNQLFNNKAHARKKSSLLSTMIWLGTLGLVMAGQDLMPMWMYTVLWCYVMGNGLWSGMKKWHKKDTGSHSTCCQCGEKSTDIAPCEEHASQCACCDGTGVCGLDCMNCKERLALKFDHLLKELPADPPLVAATRGDGKFAARASAMS